MSTIKFAVTFNPRSDDVTGLQVLELLEATRVIEFAAMRGMVGARIIPVGHAEVCPCYLHRPVVSVSPYGDAYTACCGNCGPGLCYVDQMTGEASEGWGWQR